MQFRRASIRLIGRRTSIVDSYQRGSPGMYAKDAVNPKDLIEFVQLKQIFVLDVRTNGGNVVNF